MLSQTALIKIATLILLAPATTTSTTAQNTSAPAQAQGPVSAQAPGYVSAQAPGSTAPKDIIDTNARPVVFAPGVVSSPYEEVAATFTPDGNTVYFAQGTIALEICYSKKVNGEWTKPAIIAFSGRWGDWDPFLSPDA